MQELLGPRTESRSRLSVGTLGRDLLSDEDVAPTEFADRAKSLALEDVDRPEPGGDCPGVRRRVGFDDPPSLALNRRQRFVERQPGDSGSTVRPIDKETGDPPPSWPAKARTNLLVLPTTFDPG